MCWNQSSRPTLVAPHVNTGDLNTDGHTKGPRGLEAIQSLKLLYESSHLFEAYIISEPVIARALSISDRGKICYDTRTLVARVE